MELMPSWQEKLAKAKANRSPETAATELAVPKNPAFFASGVRHLNTAQEVRGFVDFASQRPLAAIGIGCEFRFAKQGVWLGNNQVAFDPHSIQPLLLSLALLESDPADSLTSYIATVDLRDDETVAALHPLLAMPVCFVGYDLKATLFCLWQRELVEPRFVWDAWVFERARHLGQFHWRYQTETETPDDLAQMRAEKDSDDIKHYQVSLLAICQRYGLPLAHAHDRDEDRLAKSFQTFVSEQNFTQEQIEYAGEMATVSVQLYLAQVAKATTGGILQHMTNIEMPWVITNARMEWHGFRVDADRREETRAVAQRISECLGSKLKAQGLSDPASPVQLQIDFQKLGLLTHFVTPGGYCFDKEQLKLLEALHPTVKWLGHWRRAKDILSDKLLLPQLVGTDGRMHAQLRQLGTETGRQTSRWPNVLGVNRWLRPIVIPDPGFGIGEVDWSQIEVGVAGAVYEDQRLIDMFNSGDVYAAMAQLFFADELSEEARSLSSWVFKQDYPEKRHHMKVCTLGIIYGMTASGIARQLQLPLAQAEQIQKRFLALFPDLDAAKNRAMVFGGFRGYAETVTGLRRYRGKQGNTSTWERNWLGNHPVQGSAAAMFKLAGNRLDRLFPRYRAKLLIPMHDAFIFEAPNESLSDVAALTGRVMCEAVQEMFPKLQPRVDVNIEHPQCWNKEGLIEPMQVWWQEVEALLQ